MKAALAAAMTVTLLAALFMFVRNSEAVTVVGHYLQLRDQVEQDARIQEARADLWEAENCEPIPLFTFSDCRSRNPYRQDAP